MDHKEAVAKALFRRAGSHWADLTIRCREEQRMMKELKDSGYPARRIVMNKKAQVRNEEKKTKSNRYRRFTIPYLNGLPGHQEGNEEGRNTCIFVSIQNHWTTLKTSQSSSFKRRRE